MSDYKRLTSYKNFKCPHYIENIDGCYKESSCEHTQFYECFYCNKCQIKAMCDRLQELENKFENGKLVEFKYKVGDEVWTYIFGYGCAVNVIILGVEYDSELNEIMYHTQYPTHFKFQATEDELFTTKEEAEAELKKRQKGYKEI
jgi:hypothetical protein